MHVWTARRAWEPRGPFTAQDREKMRTREAKYISGPLAALDLFRLLKGLFASFGIRPPPPGLFTSFVKRSKGLFTSFGSQGRLAAGRRAATSGGHFDARYIYIYIYI